MPIVFARLGGTLRHLVIGTESKFPRRVGPSPLHGESIWAPSKWASQAKVKCALCIARVQAQRTLCSARPSTESLLLLGWPRTAIGQAFLRLSPKTRLRNAKDRGPFLSSYSSVLEGVRTRRDGICSSGDPVRARHEIPFGYSDKQ